jgi:hypothetical protein
MGVFLILGYFQGRLNRCYTTRTEPIEQKLFLENGVLFLMRRQRSKPNPFIYLMLYGGAGFLFSLGLMYVFGTAFGQLASQAIQYMAAVMSVAILVFLIGLIGFLFTRRTL